LRTPALLLNPVLADGARIVFAAAPKHWPNCLVDEERAAESNRAQGNPQHASDLGGSRVAAQLDKR
jgi:hypothetical protein